MKKIAFVLAMFLFPFSAFATSYVGKWKSAAKETHEYEIAQIKNDKKSSAKSKKKMIAYKKKMFKAYSNASSVLNFKKDKTFRFVAKIPYGKGKVFKRTTSGTWKTTKTGMEYTTISTLRGKKVKTLRTCKMVKSLLKCTLVMHKKKYVAFWTPMK